MFSFEQLEFSISGNYRASFPSHSLVYGLNFKQIYIMGDSMLIMLFGFLPPVPKKVEKLALLEALPSSQGILEFSASTLICLLIDCELKYVVSNL